MSPEQSSKIEAGITACAELGDGVGLPFTRLAAYIRALETDPAWTASEIVGLQTRVIRGLLSGPNGSKEY